jgi:cytosine/adenosine deaminase-related metal-dependent hydrolase
LLLRGATVVASAREALVLEDCDVLVEGARIRAVGRGLPAPGAQTLELRGRLLMPGLVNAHSHSYASLFRGTVAGEPLDLFVLNAMARRAPRPTRFAYVAAALHALELLANGVTAVVDHLRHGALPTLEAVEAALQAYRDAGIRAVVAPMYEDRPYLESLPIDRGRLPEGIAARWRAATKPPPQAYFELMEELVRRWPGRVMLGVDGPQRCSDRLLEMTGEFMARHGVGFHTHLLEAKTQAAMGDLVAPLERHGLVGPRSSFAHFVWCSDAQIARVAERGASVVHNPASNLLLGSGIAPVARMLRKGVNVALGTDSSSGNRPSVLEQARLAALLSHTAEPDSERWLGSREALALATTGGARVLGIEGLGEIREGALADLVVLDPRRLGYRSRGDLWSHLVMYEASDAVETAMVGGEIVFRDGRHVRLDAEALAAEADALAAADDHANAAHLARAAEERPAMKRLLQEVLDR